MGLFPQRMRTKLADTMAATQCADGCQSHGLHKGLLQPATHQCTCMKAAQGVHLPHGQAGRSDGALELREQHALHKLRQAARPAACRARLARRRRLAICRRPGWRLSYTRDYAAAGGPHRSCGCCIVRHVSALCGLPSQCGDQHRLACWGAAAAHQIRRVLGHGRLGIIPRRGSCGRSSDQARQRLRRAVPQRQVLRAAQVRQALVQQRRRARGAQRGPRCLGQLGVRAQPRVVVRLIHLMRCG